MEPIYGKQLAQHIREKAAERVAKMQQPPGLAAILVGDDPASHLYVSLKERAAKKIGIYVETLRFPADVKETELTKTVRELNERSDINGILVQLPLPGQNEDNVIKTIQPSKDIDGFHQENRKSLMKGEPALVPPVALAIMRLIQATNQMLDGKSAVIISNNKIFAEPLIEVMKENGIEGTYVDPNGSALEAKSKAADIIVVAVGRKDFVTKEMVKPGAIIIDVGANKTEDDQTVGDVAASAAEHAAFISPVPGGVGPLTVAYLMMNVIRAVQLQKE